MKKSIQFIINPKSGGKTKNELPFYIEKYLNKQLFDYGITFTKSENDTLEHAKKFVENQTNIIVAVGGDGTINNIAKFLTNSNSVLGIIPYGSGNGFARELNLYGSLQKSIEVINQQKTKLVDTGMVNEHFFCNLSGVGFDAHVGGLFANSTSRGLKTYAKITLNEFKNYKSKRYLIKSGEGLEESVEAFMICVCNGPQFGNNAFIAPEAKLDDNYFDIAVVKPFPIWKTPSIALSLFLKTGKNLSFIKRVKTSSFTIIREKEDMVNIDGEAVLLGKELQFKIHPLSLKILVP